MAKVNTSDAGLGVTDSTEATGSSMVLTPAQQAPGIVQLRARKISDHTPRV